MHQESAKWNGSYMYMAKQLLLYLTTLLPITLLKFAIFTSGRSQKGKKVMLLIVTVICMKIYKVPLPFVSNFTTTKK